MENASKALLIAAAVLIVIIIIAVGMRIYTSSQGTGKVATDTGKTISDKTEDATDLAVSEITGNKIQYFSGNTENKKNKKDVGVGDTIKIGTEKFTVFSVDEEGIKAMPHYNLVIENGTVKQGPEISGKSTEILSAFSERIYWKTDENGNEISGWNSKKYKISLYSWALDISINNPSNLIYKYINKYKASLSQFGASNIEVRVAYRKELSSEYIYHNPGQIGEFWTSSVEGSDGEGNYFVNQGGSPANIGGFNSLRGVRPIIIINK